MTATTNDLGHVACGNNTYKMVTIQFPQADTYAEGTIMARKDISDTVTVAYTRAGSSDYTATAAFHTSVTPELGGYVVTAGTLTAGVGTWTAVAPVTGASETFTSTAADDDLVFTNLGLTLTVTAVASEFETGDVITATTAADGDYVIYDPDGKGGAQVPKGVLHYAKTVTAQSDVTGNVIVGGEVNKNRLVIDDTTTVDDTHVNMLQDVGVHAVDQDDLSMTDNTT